MTSNAEKNMKQVKILHKINRMNNDGSTNGYGDIHTINAIKKVFPIISHAMAYI